MSTVSIAQLSDTHMTLDASRAPFHGRIDPRACFEQAVDAVLRLDPLPDACLHTGDIAESGRPDEYRATRAALARLEARMPVYLLPGNHDDRESMRDVWSDAEWMPRDGPIRYGVDVGPLQLIALDTVTERQSHGGLDDDQLSWLAGRLETSDRPTIVALHHPPFDVGIPFMDRIGLRSGADELDRILRRHRHVLRVVCGHVHRPVTAAFGGTIGMVAPGTAHQIPYRPRAEAAAQWTNEPPGFALHVYEGRSLRTHVLPVAAADCRPY